MTGSSQDNANAQSTAWPPTLTPYIAVGDARSAIDWYARVLGATPRGEPVVMPDGSIGHAEIGIGDAVLMLAEGSDEVPVQPPQAGGTYSHTLHVQVADVDDTVERARQNGAEIERQPTDQPYGRVAVMVDPFGHRWMLNKPPATATRERHGDVAYITLALPDSQPARQFYGSVLGWEFEPGSIEDGWNVTDVRPMVGIAGGASSRPDVQLCYHVEDVDVASERVRQHGGTAGQPEHKPYGVLVDCVDNQGARFQLFQPSA